MATICFSSTGLGWTPPRTRADGASHNPIRLMHKLALLPPLCPVSEPQATQKRSRLLTVLEAPAHSVLDLGGVQDTEAIKSEEGRNHSETSQAGGWTSTQGRCQAWNQQSRTFASVGGKQHPEVPSKVGAWSFPPPGRSAWLLLSGPGPSLQMTAWFPAHSHGTSIPQEG